MGELHNAFTKLMNGYAQAASDNDSEFARFIRNDITAVIEKSNIFDTEIYSFKASNGVGRWATVPWAAIFNNNETTSAQKGIYIVYLLSTDQKRLYLTVNQGSNAFNGRRPTEKIDGLLNVAAHYKSLIKHGSFSTEPIDLGTPTNNSKNYEYGTIFCKKYEKDQVPDDDQLFQDLKEAKQLYDEILKIKKTANGDFVPANDADTLIFDEIEAYIQSKGFFYTSNLIKNFYLCLKSKPFVILAGISGTGKTRLARLFAEAVCEDPQEQYLQIAVRPDWSDPSDLIGHLNLNGKYQPGPVLEFIKKASDNLDRPYFLCLDEMNLARVEYYFSDFLSIIETRDRASDPTSEIRTDTLIKDTYFGDDEDAKTIYCGLSLPENLYIIGTVNMDETTFPFSRKVLDRANTIEISYVDLNNHSVDTFESDKPNLDNEFFKSKYIKLAEIEDSDEKINYYINILKQINDELKLCNSQVGYRIRDEFVFYLIYNDQYKLMSETDAIDLAIMQKILPRIHGSSISIKESLCNLFKFCCTGTEDITYEYSDAGSRMASILKDKHIRFPLCAEKIASMVRRFEEDGFTTFWI